MAPPSSREELYSLLQGVAPTDQDLARLRQLREDQWLEFKDGRLLQQTEKELREEIRRYVTGFANAEGGIFVVGIEESDARNVVGVVAPGRAPVTEWATQLLSGYATQFDPFPRIFPIQHSGLEVLVIATDRAPQLIAYTRGSQMLYALRIHELTLDMPPFLATDLLVGRRNHPVFVLSDVRRYESALVEPGVAQLGIHWTVENASLVEARSVRVGIVSKSLESLAAPRSDYLLKYVQDEELPPIDDWPPVTPVPAMPAKTRPHWTVKHSKGMNRGDAPLKPFDLFPDTALRFASVPRHVVRGTLEFAVYVMAEGSPPRWYQCVWKYELGRQANAPVTEGEILCGRVTDTPPRLSWKPGWD